MISDDGGDDETNLLLNVTAVVSMCVCAYSCLQACVCRVCVARTASPSQSERLTAGERLGVR